MNIMIPGGEHLTMSSREIADLLESRHDKVKQSIERLVGRGAIGQPPMGDDLYTDAQGKDRTISVYRLPKRDTYVVVAQLSPGFTARLVDRWQELESQQQIMPDLSDPAVLTSLLIEHAGKRIEAEKRAVVAEERADAFEGDSEALGRIARAEGSLCVTDAAKALQVQPKVLFSFLRQNRWTYKRPPSSVDVGYQTHVANGDLEHKITTVLRPDGSEKTTCQVRITSKGLAKLAKLIPRAVDEVPRQNRSSGT